MKKKILDCAIADFLVYGFKNVTMDDLAQKLGISKKTIYDNFSTKQELVAEAANTIFENVSSTIQKIHREEIDPVKSLFDIKKEVTKYYNDVQNSPQYGITFGRWHGGLIGLLVPEAGATQRTENRNQA